MRATRDARDATTRLERLAMRARIFWFVVEFFAARALGRAAPRARAAFAMRVSRVRRADARARVERDGRRDATTRRERERRPVVTSTEASTRAVGRAAWACGTGSGIT